MDNEAILRQMSLKDFAKVVDVLLRTNRDKPLIELAELPLAHTLLVEDCFLDSEDGETVSDRVRAQIMQANLCWGIEQLRPDGEHSWIAHKWRFYNVLHFPYIRDIKFAKLGLKIGVTEQTLHRRIRPKALVALGNVLQGELKRGRNLQARNNYVLSARYQTLSEQERQLLRMGALFRKPFFHHWLYQLAEEPNISNISNSIRGLITANLFKSLDEGTQIYVEIKMRDYLLPLLSPEERWGWHQVAAKHYQEQHDILEAAYHLRRMNNGKGYQLAAHCLVKNQQAMINDQQVSELSDFVAQFQRHELPDALWFQLKILAGDVALVIKEVDSAIKEYGEALWAKESQTRALAYYKRAEAYTLCDPDQAVAHYTRGINLLTTSKSLSDSRNPLLTKLYIGRAWIHIQVHPNLALAEQDLQRASQIVAHDHSSEAKLHNAWAGLYVRQKDNSKVIHHRLQAYLAAEETQNLELQARCAKNLGFDYAELREDYDHAIKYLTQSVQLARQAGTPQLEGLANKDIGACYFWQEQYHTAIEYYQQARVLLVETGNLNWLTVVYHDLVEAYAETKQLPEATRYFDKGVKLAKQMGHLRYIEAFQDLALRLPGLPPVDADLNLRQLNALEYVKKHKQITREIHIKLNPKKDNPKKHLSKATANRDLKQMCNKGFLSMHKNGRSTYYTLPLPE